MMGPRCDKCELHKTCEYVRLPGQGAKHPSIMFIGEAPGREEEKEGQPFVGRSGKILRKLVAQMGVGDSCYITNVVKCRPPDNATPTPKQIAACLPYLEQEIRIRAPQYLVLLGATAIKAITGEKAVVVAQKRGIKNWKYKGIQVVATYHPAAVLRDESRLDAIIDDLNRIYSHEFTNPEKVTWKEVKKVKTVPSVMAFDLETNRLSPWKSGGKILCVSWSGKENQAYVTRDCASFLEAVGRKKPILVGHNIKFDLLWLRKVHGYRHADSFEDTMVMAHLLDENAPSKGLKYLASIHTGYGDYARDVLPLRKKGKLEELSQEQLFEYAAYDAAATWRVRKELMATMSKSLQNLFEIQMAVLYTLIEMEVHGIRVDFDVLKKLKKLAKRKITNLTNQLRIAIGLSSAHIGPSEMDINFDSTQQLSRLLFETLGFKPIKRTEKGHLSTNEYVLSRLRHQVAQKLSVVQGKKFIDRLIDRRALKKLQSTYIDPVEDFCHDGVLHTNYNITGTVTGRLSSSEPNMQNIPRDDKLLPVRTIFIPAKEKIFIAADYSQMELRVAAYLTRDSNMLELLRAGKDLHTETARQIVGHEPSAEERFIAKTVNFGIFYGMGAYRLADETGMPKTEAARFIRGWYLTYPAVKPWQDERQQELMGKGYVESMFGRRRRLPLIVVPKSGGKWSAAAKEYQAVLRQACNFPVQSAAAEIALMAMSRLQSLCKFPGASVVLNEHDGLLIECPLTSWKNATYWKRLIRKTLENVTSILSYFGYCIDFDVPTPVELKVGTSWGDMEETK